MMFMSIAGHCVLLQKTCCCTYDLLSVLFSHKLLLHFMKAVHLSVLCIVYNTVAYVYDNLMTTVMSGAMVSYQYSCVRSVK